METIFLSANNVVPNTNNNVLKFNFANNVSFDKDTKIALKSVDMYYSWFNISKSYNNNTFQYMWWGPAGLLTELFTVTIPDGNYDIDLINEFLQSELIKNKHYVTDTINGVTSAVYFFEFVPNATKYKYQINCYFLPSSSQIQDSYTYIKPVGATWAFPIVGSTSQIIINENNEFKKLIGFSPGSYPSTTKTTKSSIVGDLIPEIDPVSSIIVSCNLVSQKYAYPNDLLYTFSNNATQFGGVISFEVNQYSWCNVASGTYKNIEVRFYDQNYNTIEILDSQMTISLIIDETKEEDK